MKFRKINDTKIKCTISQEELWEKGVAIEDFLEDRSKVEAFVRDVLHEAANVLDLRGMGNMYSVQMSPLPEGGLSMIITSEKGNAVLGKSLEELGKRLEGFKEIMEEAKKHLEDTKQGDSIEQAQQTDDTDEIEAFDMPLWVHVYELEDAIALAHHMMVEPKESRLYHYDDGYYLSLDLGEKKHEIAETILTASEFSEEVFRNSQGGDLLLEHGDIILDEDAVAKLKRL